MRDDEERREAVADAVTRDLTERLAEQFGTGHSRMRPSEEAVRRAVRIALLLPDEPDEPESS